MIYLRDFVLKLAKEKEIKLHEHTKLAIREIERKMEKNDSIEVQDIMSDLKDETDLKKGFSSSEWGAIEKEVKKMI